MAANLAKLERKIANNLEGFIKVGKSLIWLEDHLSPADFKQSCIRATGMHPDELRPLLDLARELLT